MSDRLNGLFDQLRAAGPPAPFLPADRVRARGRNRSNRQALAFAGVTLATVGVSGGLVAAAYSSLPGAGLRPDRRVPDRPGAD